jgi:hypothetical protein
MPLQSIFKSLDDKNRAMISVPIDFGATKTFRDEPKSMVKEMLELNLEKKANFLAINNVDDTCFEFNAKPAHFKKKKRKKADGETSSSSEIESSVPVPIQNSLTKSPSKNA